jgi:hypothetical protein
MLLASNTIASILEPLIRPMKRRVIAVFDDNLNVPGATMPVRKSETPRATAEQR